MTQNKIELNEKAKQIDMSKWSRLNVHDENQKNTIIVNEYEFLLLLLNWRKFSAPFKVSVIFVSLQLL